MMIKLQDNHFHDDDHHHVNYKNNNHNDNDYQSWAQRKLGLLNILLSINSPLLSFRFTDLKINRCNFQKFNDQHFQRF